MPECFKQPLQTKMEREKLTSINMKVSSRLHNQRTTLAEQDYRLGALLNQRPLQKQQNSLHILKKYRKQQQRRAQASMALHRLSQTAPAVSSAHAFLCQTRS
jgi:hypothetical protein